MFLSNATLGLIIMLAIFMGVLSATVNSFSGFVTYYLIEFNKSAKTSENNDYRQFDIRKQR